MTSTHPDPAPAGTGSVTFLTAPFARRTWYEFGHLWLMLLLAPFAFAYAVTAISLTASLAWTVVGLFVAGGLLLGARGWGAMYRGTARGMLGTTVAPPAPYVRPRGFWRSLGAPFADGDSWRALLFMFLTFPLSIVSAVVSTALLVTGLGAVSYPLWYRFLPLQQASDGSWHRGSQLGPDYFIDTPGRMLLHALAGVLVLLLWPWITHAFSLLFQVLTAALLGPTRTGERIAALRATRATAVEDADARLRRIERDLHDGTQARLVAVAMQLGEAREHLATGGDQAEAASLVDAAHASTKEALTELREIARGIHPPALDAGLAVALDTLAARSPLPVTVDVDAAIEADGPLSPAVQSIVYYTVAELLTNVVKHADASGAYVMVQPHDAHALRVRVRDDGRGGAVVESGGSERTGLAGLMERAAAVDGLLEVSSPAGGPTIVTVTLPTTTRP